jgi:hypothetical protein
LEAGATTGGRGSESEVPTTKSGRVRKKRIASNIPQNEKRVLAKRVNWCWTSKPVKYSQREKLVGNIQMRYTAG